MIIEVRIFIGVATVIPPFKNIFDDGTDRGSGDDGWVGRAGGTAVLVHARAWVSRASLTRKSMGPPLRRWY